MSLKAKGLLSLMLSLPDDWNYSISGLVTLSKDGKDSVMSALGELEEFGYLVRNRTINSKGQFSGIEYNIYESPQEKKPVADNQNSDNQNSGKANSGNPPLLNTKLTKNLNNQELNESNKEIEENYLSLYDDILNNIRDVEIKNLYVDYLEMRRITGSPMTKRGLSMLINRTSRLANFDRKLEIQMLETAIINNWKGTYYPQKEEEAKSLIKKDTLSELKDFYNK
jgi:hypothetical protein